MYMCVLYTCEYKYLMANSNKTSSLNQKYIYRHK